MPQHRNPALPDFINYLATGHTVQQASEAVGVSPRTGYRWAAQDEVDKQVYERRQTLTAVAIDRLTNATDGICAGLIELAAHGPDNIRVSASKACISTMIQLRKFSEVEGRLRAIESRQQASAESTADSADRWPATMEDGPPNLMGMIRAESTRHTANWLAIRMNDPGRSDYEKEQFQIQIDNLRDTSRHLEWTAGKLDPYIRATIANSQQPIWDDDDPRRTDVRRGAPDPSVAQPSPLGPHPIPDPEMPGSPRGPDGFCAPLESSSPDSVAQPSALAPRPNPGTNLLILLLSASLLTNVFGALSFGAGGVSPLAMLTSMAPTEAPSDTGEPGAVRPRMLTKASEAFRPSTHASHTRSLLSFEARDVSPPVVDHPTKTGRWDAGKSADSGLAQKPPGPRDKPRGVSAIAGSAIVTDKFRHVDRGRCAITKTALAGQRYQPKESSPASCVTTKRAKLPFHTNAKVPRRKSSAAGSTHLPQILPPPHRLCGSHLPSSATISSFPHHSRNPNPQTRNPLLPRGPWLSAVHQRIKGKLQTALETKVPFDV